MFKAQLSVQLNDIMTNVDVNGDALLSRFELLIKMRHQRKYADFLKLPPRIKEGDGTYAKFIAKFLEIDHSRDGFISEAELEEYFRGQERKDRALASSTTGVASRPSSAVVAQ